MFFPSSRAFSIHFENVSITVSKSDWLKLGFLSFSCLIKVGLDNYFSFFCFFPIAFSNIPFSVAPDFVAPSPNLAIKDFSSSI